MLEIKIVIHAIARVNFPLSETKQLLHGRRLKHLRASFALHVLLECSHFEDGFSLVPELCLAELAVAFHPPFRKFSLLLHFLHEAAEDSVSLFSSRLISNLKPGHTSHMGHSYCHATRVGGLCSTQTIGDNGSEHERVSSFS